ncbi:MAG: Sec-independent protein translocase protein TatB [Bauldia sp.]
MFDIGWSELLVIAVVAIVVIGPKDLPKAMRLVGQWTGKMKRMARDFQGQFNEAMREAELDGVRKQVEAIGKIDPTAGVRKELAKTSAEIRKGLDKPGEAEARGVPAEPAAALVAPSPAARPAPTGGDVKP